MKFDTWKVAASILYLLNKRDGIVCNTVDYKTLTKWVIKTGLTTLGDKGSTPEQTMNSLLKKKRDVFYYETGGIYALADESLVDDDAELMNIVRLVKS
jgi:hypothetical protein